MICNVCQKEIQENDELFKLMLCINNGDLFSFKGFDEWVSHKSCFPNSIIEESINIQRNEIFNFME